MDDRRCRPAVLPPLPERARKAGKCSPSPIYPQAPQSLDKDVVHASALAVHADRDPVPFQGAGEVVAGELAALVGIEDLRLAIA